MHGCWLDKLQLVWREWVACVAFEDPITADVGLLRSNLYTGYYKKALIGGMLAATVAV
jgi:hypothetical protein